VILPARRPMRVADLHSVVGSKSASMPASGTERESAGAPRQVRSWGRSGRKVAVLSRPVARQNLTPRRSRRLLQRYLVGRAVPSAKELRSFIDDLNPVSGAAGTSRPNSLRSRNIRRCEEGGSNTPSVLHRHKQPRWSSVRQGKAIQHGERDTLGIFVVVPQNFRPSANECGDVSVYYRNKNPSYDLLKFANSSIFF
jgi:hypothetical protein